MNLQSIIPWKKEERSLARGRSDGDPFAQLQRRMNSVFEDFFGRSSSDLWGDAAGEFLPRVDVSETGKEVCGLLPSCPVSMRRMWRPR